MKLDWDFYQRDDVVEISRDLLGKVLVTNVGGVLTSGIIVETEAYSWRERGSHAYGAKLTPRTSVMFREGGRAYVYLCYGMHHLFNVVTNREGVAEAVLVRALEPLDGIPAMAARRGSKVKFHHLTSGPGKLTRSLGIDRTLNGKLLSDDEIWIEDGKRLSASQVEVSRRIGIDYAGEDALLPWRFSIKGNPWVSKA
jgi:DNA-3-methyladenine glycosylase